MYPLVQLQRHVSKSVKLTWALRVGCCGERTRVRVERTVRTATLRQRSSSGDNNGAAGTEGYAFSHGHTYAGSHTRSHGGPNSRAACAFSARPRPRRRPQRRTFRHRPRPRCPAPVPTITSIDVNGNDGNSGTSEATAWRSLEKGSAFTLSPGARLLLRRGGVWTGTLKIEESGAGGIPVVIASYGERSAANHPGRERLHSALRFGRCNHSDSGAGLLVRRENPGGRVIQPPRRERLRGQRRRRAG